LGNPRLYLSPPHLSGDEARLVQEVFASNWIAPLGPMVDAFEREMCERIGVDAALAVSSGTAALHLALRVLGLEPGDPVLISTLTFSATANAAAYCGAVPTFVDSTDESWCLDPALVAEEVGRCARAGRPPKAIITVDIYGQSSDYDAILPAAARHGVPVVEDAAEALGATYRGRAAGSFGEMGILSFNGNKIITTSGGGMLLSARKDRIDRARFLATQARDPAPHYQHSEIGFNYRMSNILAAVGRGQLASLDQKVEARRRNFEYYARHLGPLPGITFMPEPAHGRSTRWLTCLTIDPDRFGATREDVRLALEARNIEARPVWKPMHLQPVFADCRFVGSGVSDRLFANGLCLPSGSAMTECDLERTVEVVRSCHRR
jgi:pyridoxal phosphate-dependent aminotransferase EpsN